MCVLFLIVLSLITNISYGAAEISAAKVIMLSNSHKDNDGRQVEKLLHCKENGGGTVCKKHEGQVLDATRRKSDESLPKVKALEEGSDDSPNGAAEVKKKKHTIKYTSAAKIIMLSNSYKDNDRLQVEKFLHCEKNGGGAVCKKHEGQVLDATRCKSDESLPKVKALEEGSDGFPTGGDKSNSKSNQRPDSPFPLKDYDE